MRGRKHTRQFNDLRLIALQEVLDKSKVSRRMLAARIGLPSGTVQSWFEDNRWPAREADRIEIACDLPLGFFALICEGKSADEALAVLWQKIAEESGQTPVEDKAPDYEQLSQQLKEILETSEDYDQEIEQWKQHLGRQIGLIYRTIARQKRQKGATENKVI